MKRIVGSIWGMSMMVVIPTMAVVVATGAGAGATYLIAIGFMAIALGILRAQDSAP